MVVGPSAGFSVATVSCVVALVSAAEAVLATALVLPVGSRTVTTLGAATAESAAITVSTTIATRAAVGTLLMLATATTMTSAGIAPATVLASVAPATFAATATIASAIAAAAVRRRTSGWGNNFELR